MRKTLGTLALLALGACSTSGGGLGTKDGLAFAQVQSIQPGLTAAQVLDAFGPPSRMSRGPDGKIEHMQYAALDAKQSREHLSLDFDAREVLVTKTFSGQVTRP